MPAHTLSKPGPDTQPAVTAFLWQQYGTYHIRWRVAGEAEQYHTDTDKRTLAALFWLLFPAGVICWGEGVNAVIREAPDRLEASA